MIKKIRPIDIKNVLSENDAEAKNEELLQKEIAEFDRIAEVLKQREKEKTLAGEDASEEDSFVEKTPENDALLEDEVKAEIAKHVRAREAALKAMKKAPVLPAKPAEEGPFMELRVKHVLDPVEEEDGTRLLVERVWPKDLNRKTYPMTDWQPAVGPTLTLRKALSEAPEKYDDFAAGYKDFLSKDPAALEFKAEIRTILQVENVTFLHASEDRSRNSASVLREWVLE